MPDLPLIAVVDLVTSIGGVQQVTASVWPRLTDRFRVAIIDPYGNPEYARLFRGAGVDRIDLLPPPSRRYIGGHGPARLLALASRAPWLGAAALRLRRWIRGRRPKVLCFNQLPALLLFSRVVPRDTRVVYHAHGIFSAGEVRRLGNVARRCSRVVAVSRAVADAMGDAGIDRGRIEVIHNGVDVDALRKSAASGEALPPRAPGEVVLAHVGVLAPHKQQHVSIDALARLPLRAVLWLCGDVPEGGDAGYGVALRSRAAALGVESRVHFLGWRNDAAHVISRADVAILPSVQESFGMVLAEAMALGKPCVGAKVGGIPEVIEDGVTGRVVPADAAAFAAALDPLVSSAALRHAMGDAGAHRVARLFTLEAQADRLARVLAVALDGALARGPAQRTADTHMHDDACDTARCP
ncbi:glycosyltransferase [Anaeromyxobacter sp. Fw109-5]|uniref:glycosyltransferase n=1 Tax=Anaeromyxobacter sp. (strain Fw109-5) TaxID=404589 RepID=UPI0000ED73D1|nr:glycosyltransferase [Anaeromyxobacter sp. Fw109-5]ABS26829.1 glycosyl transferase group 1 [Anaeromyxobacter sp. Fw109-5]